MLDEKRIRQMTKLAFFEKKEEKNALRIGRYFRSDYIGKELLKNFFLASIGYILGPAVCSRVSDRVLSVFSGSLFHCRVCDQHDPLPGSTEKAEMVWKRAG